jgi:hypothetical protein
MSTMTIELDGNQQKLLDINEDFQYFESDISVVPSEKGKVSAGIVSQEDLDSGEYRLNEIKNDELTISINNSDAVRKYQNYFLCLKSASPTKVDVTINTKKVLLNKSREHPEGAVDTDLVENYQHPSSQSSFYGRLALGVLILIVGVFLLRKFSNN